MTNIWMIVFASAIATACAAQGVWPSLNRPPALAGEWTDMSRSTANDTAVMIMRADGYNGVAHLRVARDSMRGPVVQRTQTRNGSWYVGGGHALCVSRRPGRDGATCFPFSLDTVMVGGDPLRHLVVHDPGEHQVQRDLEFLERRKGSRP